MLRTRLGMSMGLPAHECTCAVAASAVGGRAANEPAWNDYHARVCPFGGHTQMGHNAVVGALVDTLASWGLQPQAEQRTVFRDDPGKMRMDIVLARPGGARLCVEVSVRDAGAANCLGGAAQQRGAIAALRAEEKRTKYADKLCDDCELAVYACDNFGAVAPETLALLGRLVGFGQRTTQGHAGDLRAQLLRALSAAYFKGLAGRYGRHTGGQTAHPLAGACRGAPIIRTRCEA